MSGWFVTSNNIKMWTATDKRRAEEVLPLLVKKLILASSKPEEINFPSGNAVTTGGWDGILEVEEGTIALEGDREEVLSNEHVKEAFLGI